MNSFTEKCIMFCIVLIALMQCIVAHQNKIITDNQVIILKSIKSLKQVK